MSDATPDLLEKMGQLIDKCDNLLVAATLPLPASIHVEGLSEGLKTVRADLFEIYIQAGGEDVWPQTDDEDTQP